MVKDTMCYKNFKYFSMLETEKEEFLENQLQSELHSHAASYRRVLHERAVQQKHISSSFPNLEHSEAKLRVRVQTEELMMTSMMEGLRVTSESGRQAVLSAQELAAVLRMKCRKKLKPVISGKTK